MKSLFALLLVVSLLIPQAGSALAQEGISASAAVQVTFPTQIVFTVDADSSADITDVFLRYKVDEIATVKVTTVVQPDFEPGPQVSTAWTWLMKKSLMSLPPGARVHYSWRIVDATGRQLETPWETVRFNDNRHAWSVLTQGDVTLHWYKGDRAFAEALLAAANTALERLGADAGATLRRPVSAYVYATSDELRSAILYPPDWMGGAAFSNYATIAVAASPAALDLGNRFVIHELAHLVTYQMTVNPYASTPRWLDEGLSTYAEGSLRSDLAQALNRAVSSDSLLSIQTISSNFPSDFEDAKLSYGESYSVVGFLIDQYGTDRMVQLLGVFKEGASYNEALSLAYGFDTAELDNLWRESLGLPPREPTSAPESQPAPTPDGGFFSCQGASAATGDHNAAGLVLLSLIILPGAGQLLLRRSNARKPG